MALHSTLRVSQESKRSAGQAKTLHETEQPSTLEVAQESKSSEGQAKTLPETEQPSTLEAAQKSKSSTRQAKTKREANTGFFGGLLSKKQGTATSKQPAPTTSPVHDLVPILPQVAFKEIPENAVYVSDQFEALKTPYQAGDEIPTIIHRFWSGGPMNENTMNVLIDGATKVKGKDWSNRLWYSSTLEDALYKKVLSKEDRKQLKAQRAQLQELGYTVASIEDLASEIQRESKIQQEKTPPITQAQIKQFAMSAAGIKIEGGKQSNNGIKHLSDVARLMYGYHFGGHHFDTDMGLGSMSLEKPYKHNDPKNEVPLMGAVGVVPYDYERITGLKVGVSIDAGTDEGKKAAANLITNAINMSTVLNGMFATRAKNPHIKDTLEQLVRIYKGQPLSTPGTNVTSTMVYGKEIADSFTPTSSDDKVAMRRMTVPPYILDVQAFTEESANRNAV